jgi:LuxR family maltose regulon positive regulatory protein
VGELVLVRLAIARGDAEGAERRAADLAREAAQNGFAQRIPEIAALRSLAASRAGRDREALERAMESGNPLALAAARLEAGEAARALEAAGPYRAMAEGRGWKAEAIRASLLEALALRDLGRSEEALAALRRALVAAEEGGYVRSFLDLGPRMSRLLDEVADSGEACSYARTLLARWGKATGIAKSSQVDDLSVRTASRGEKVLLDGADFHEPLSRRETEVLRLIELGLSNEEICERLFIALDTVKGHNRKIFEKLSVKRRTEAVARARALRIL